LRSSACTFEDTEIAATIPAVADQPVDELASREAPGYRSARVQALPALPDEALVVLDRLAVLEVDEDPVEFGGDKAQVFHRGFEALVELLALGVLDVG
jgi:hypothetical protein